MDVSAWRLANFPGTRPGLVGQGRRSWTVILGSAVAEARSLDEALGRALRAHDETSR